MWRYDPMKENIVIKNKQTRDKADTFILDMVIAINKLN